MGFLGVFPEHSLDMVFISLCALYLTSLFKISRTCLNGFDCQLHVLVRKYNYDNVVMCGSQRLKQCLLLYFIFRLFRNLMKEVRMYAQKFIDRGKVFTINVLLLCNSGFNTVQCSWSIESNFPLADRDQKRCLLTGIVLWALVDSQALPDQLWLLGPASESCLWPKTPVLSGTLLIVTSFSATSSWCWLVQKSSVYQKQYCKSCWWFWADLCSLKQRKNFPFIGLLTR